MSLSMYQASVPVFLRALHNLRDVLHKGEAHAIDKGYDPGVLLQTRLIPDMLPLVRQVQIATDMAKGTAARLAGEDPPRFEDNEASFAELKARVARTVAFLQELQPTAFEGSEDRAITLKVGPPGNKRELNFVGLDYLLGFGTPNVYFHYSMAYALLRHNGLDIGKPDYVGA